MVPYNPELDIHGNQKVVPLQERARWEEQSLKFLQVFQSLFLGHIVLWSSHYIPVEVQTGPVGGGWYSQTRCIHGIPPPPQNSFLPTEEFLYTKENFISNPQDVLWVLFMTEGKRCPSKIQERISLMITFSKKTCLITKSFWSLCSSVPLDGVQTQATFTPNCSVPWILRLSVQRPAPTLPSCLI